MISRTNPVLLRANARNNLLSKRARGYYATRAEAAGRQVGRGRARAARGRAAAARLPRRGDARGGRAPRRVPHRALALMSAAVPRRWRPLVFERVCGSLYNLYSPFRKGIGRAVVPLSI